MSEENPHIAEFISITNSSKSLAEQYLQRNENDLVEAIEDYYANSEHGQQPTEQHQPPFFPQGSTSNRLGTSSRTKKAQGGIKTFRDLNNEDDDSEEDSTSNNFFTGGEKSALQVEDPNKDKGNGDQNLIEQIFQRARDQMNTPDDRPSAQQLQSSHETAHFTGTGFKLGDGTVPSEQVEDPQAQARKLLNRFRPKKVNREITFWRQGFTVGDSELYSYDDERNKRILSEIEQGRVPIAILQVDPGDDVDVTVSKRTDEDYVPPKRKIGGYHGTGHRLGSPVPGEPIVTQNKEESVKETKSADTPQKTTDEGEGDTAVQIRFANGKRTSHKFNSGDSISVVYDFVRNHEYNAESAGRNFTLSHAFPVKPIEDSNEVSIGDAKLKNSVIVQRWV
ncbi:Shp1 protein [Candida orthopsilosis Co 90-125]|uniref:Shp1 protein n=1 Tax=Candida orthopsilosis (strain 90-125) TaxID=1136231 RepID=H8WW51_CANO9|nr:Shp1 protein [Candida orthopsilosis Co 90-125]CCG20675.1 Shp1 protein [Candida orthopsilosis Co 90-125]